MKRVTFVVLMIACGSFVSQAQFFETTRRTIPTPVDVTAEQPCNPLVDRSLVFGFETLRQSSTAVDLVAGKSIWLPPPYIPWSISFHMLTTQEENSPRTICIGRGAGSATHQSFCTESSLVSYVRM